MERTIWAAVGVIPANVYFDIPKDTAVHNYHIIQAIQVSPYVQSLLKRDIVVGGPIGKGIHVLYPFLDSPRRGFSSAVVFGAELILLGCGDIEL